MKCDELAAALTRAMDRREFWQEEVRRLNTMALHRMEDDHQAQRLADASAWTGPDGPGSTGV